MNSKYKIWFITGISSGLGKELAQTVIENGDFVIGTFRHQTQAEGPFRTNFAGSSFRQAEKIIDDYNPTAGAFRERMKLSDGKQEGDPIKASKAILNITEIETPPLRLPLGRIAIISLNSKLDIVKKDIENFKNIAQSAVY